MVLQKIPAGPKWIPPQRLADPISRRFAAMIEITEDTEASRSYSDVDWLAICETAEISGSGKTHRTACTIRKTCGIPGTDILEQVVTEKFRETTAGALNPEQADQLLAGFFWYRRR